MQQRSGGGAKHCCAACYHVYHLSHLTAATATTVAALGTAEAASLLHHTVARHLHTAVLTVVAVLVVLLGRQGCVTHCSVLLLPLFVLQSVHTAAAAAAAAVCCSDY
jgi:hypothetical protein